MKSSSAPNKTPSLKRPPAFFSASHYSLFSFFCAFFSSCPLLLLPNPGETCFPYLQRRRTTQERWLRPQCICMFVCTQGENCTLTCDWTERSRFSEDFFAVNAGLYLHGSLSALCLLALACAPLILWAEVWNERRRPVADGEVRGTPEAAPPPRPTGPTPHSLTLSPTPLSHLRLPALFDATVLFPV